MIEFVRGKIVYIETEFITMDVQGIGYLVYCANPFIYQKDEGKEVTVYTYQHVREDAIRLYGFSDRQERELFQQLLQVSGIGPKGALAILASGRPDQVVEAIEQENEKFLVKFPGVGKKTARQMILDLKGKLGYVEAEGLFAEASQKESTATMSPLEEALEALRALGYGEKEISKVTPKLKQEELSADQYVKKALQLMLN
ncbi:Holliday junction branch migration protein RuvA [Bacillus sp. FJAT-44742]|uniref:Holliday junction branch migration protein RuvA n=1 Tax=Bacillus sp. FJAT-44742 TaxID=2014005 RepID=UPI000C248E02|nr:Holliday junction branch migration protein RuvA [Bacillus sp. FJAT-44742]